MLTVHSLKKTFDLQTIFENVSFSLNPGERAGLVGPNGCGKTTLLRILAGEETANAGVVSRDPDLRIGYLPQGFEPDPDAAVGEVIGRAAGTAEALEAELTAAAVALMERPNDPDLTAQYDACCAGSKKPKPGARRRSWPGWGWIGSTRTCRWAC